MSELWWGLWKKAGAAKRKIN